MRSAWRKPERKHPTNNRPNMGIQIPGQFAITVNHTEAPCAEAITAHVQTPTGLTVHHWGGMSKRLDIAKTLLVPTYSRGVGITDEMITHAFDVAERVLAEEARRLLIDNGQPPPPADKAPQPEATRDPLDGPPLSPGPILLP